MVTAETAMTLPVLVLLAMVGVATVGVGQARLRCADAAGEAARAVARGDPAAAARARSAAGAPVALSTASSASDTRVTVRMALHPVSWLPRVTITETAVVATEPGAAW
ncbi:TadE family type IV pilus minor pilin [Jatrophihabitans sp.]|uniref:TadE family type IV pilus minor pilin n=1 Tax=Jatrophihabitans sp. TaxID=1932789 RepID=UPI002CAD9386|nr:TadE family type IV pilus minor pilin [Jatrophihabitans sp.]